MANVDQLRALADALQVAVMSPLLAKIYLHPDKTRLVDTINDRWTHIGVDVVPDEPRSPLVPLP